MSADTNEALLSRRGFLAISAAALGGVMIAPGIRLIEIAGARHRSAPPREERDEEPWIGHGELLFCGPVIEGL